MPLFDTGPTADDGLWAPAKVEAERLEARSRERERQREPSGFIPGGQAAALAALRAQDGPAVTRSQGPDPALTAAIAAAVRQAMGQR